MTVFYAPGLPNVLVIIILILIANYWCDKWIFFRRLALPISLGCSIQRKMNKLTIYVPILYLIGSYMFYIVKTNWAFVTFRIKIGMLIVGVLVLIWTLLPSHIRKKKNVKKGSYEPPTYEEARLEFLTDYDIENPLTRTVALRNFLLELAIRNSGSGNGDANNIKQPTVTDQKHTIINMRGTMADLRGTLADMRGTITSPLLQIRMKEIEAMERGKKNIMGEDIYDDIDAVVEAEEDFAKMKDTKGEEKHVRKTLNSKTSITPLPIRRMNTSKEI